MRERWELNKQNYNSNMMNMKVKTAAKIICGLSAVVILCYLEDKYSIIYKNSEKSAMAGLRILSAEFEVFGIVQGE